MTYHLAESVQECLKPICLFNSLYIMLESRWKYIALYTDWFKTQAFKQSKHFFMKSWRLSQFYPICRPLNLCISFQKTKNIIQYCFFPFHIIIRHWYNWCLIHVRFYTFQHTFWKVIFEGLAKSSPFSVVWTAMDRWWLLLDRLFILPVTVGKLSRRLISIFI